MNENDREMMRKGSKIAKIVVVVVALLILISQAWYIINEQEQAVVTTFGTPKTVNESGLHFKIPFIQKVTLVDTTIKGFAIGYDPKTLASIDTESLMITHDDNFVCVDFFVEYKVSDPVKYLYNSQDPVAILKNLAQSCIRSQVGSYDVDDVITSKKNEIQGAIRERIEARLTQQDLGIQLVNITIQDAEPPTTEVMEAFKAVETAKQQAETAKNNAYKYNNEKTPAAEAQADQIVKEAEATKEARINEAKGQVERFNQMYAEFVKYPLITKQRMFFETMEEVLPDLKIIIDNTETGVQKILPMESFVSEGDK